MITPVNSVQLFTSRNIPNKGIAFKSGELKVSDSKFKGQKLNIVVDGVKNCSPLGNKLDYFA